MLSRKLPRVEVHSVAQRDHGAQLVDLVPGADDVCSHGKPRKLRQMGAARVDDPRPVEVLIRLVDALSAVHPVLVELYFFSTPLLAAKQVLPDIC